MRVFIDADGCPVVDETIRLSHGQGKECIILCDTSHRIERQGVQTVICPKGPDSVDFTLVNLLNTGDLVITQDYGLAAMCLSRGARALDQNGMEYTPENIDSLLLSRHMGQSCAVWGKGRKARKNGRRNKTPRFQKN